MERIETAKALKIIKMHEENARGGYSCFRIYKGFTDARYNSNKYYLTICKLDGFATANPHGIIIKEAKTLKGLL